MFQEIVLKRKVKEFRDISLTFSPHPVTCDLSVIKDKIAINNALKNIVFTHIGEVPFNYEFGGSLYKYLFEPVDYGTSGVMMLELERLIRMYEPRIELQNVIVDPEPEKNSWMASIFYRIIGYDEIITTKMILKQVR
jgi:phage baseplate assembly protein W